MKKLLAAASLLCLVAALTACASGNKSAAAVETAASAIEASDARGKSFRIAIDQAYAPFSIEEEEGYKGIDVELMEAVAELEGFSVELRPMDFSAIIPALVSGTVDGGLGAMIVTEERGEKVDFSDSYYVSSLALAVRADSDITSLSDLENRVLAVKEGTQGALWAEDNKEKYGFDISTLQDSESMAMAVETGQADGLLEDYTVISYGIESGERELLKIAAESVDKPGEIAFSVNKGMNQDLLAAFNQGLRKLKANGKYEEILSKYQS